MSFLRVDKDFVQQCILWKILVNRQEIPRHLKEILKADSKIITIDVPCARGKCSKILVKFWNSFYKILDKLGIVKTSRKFLGQPWLKFFAN